MAKSKLRGFLQNRRILSFTQNIETMLWKGGGKSILSLWGMVCEQLRENSGAAIRWAESKHLRPCKLNSFVFTSTATHTQTQTLDGQFAAHLHWAHNLPAVQNPCVENQSLFLTLLQPELSFAHFHVFYIVCSDFFFFISMSIPGVLEFVRLLFFNYPNNKKA